jgi:GTP-binding protein EngB required for normal cell division
MKKTNIVLCGRSGDGKSSIANMLIQGNIYRDRENVFEIGNKATGVTTEITYAGGEKFGVFDLIGLGELMSGSVPNKEAVKNIRNHFSKGAGIPLNYICYVKRPRMTEEDFNLFQLFKEIFKEGNDNFIIIVTNSETNWVITRRTLHQ